ncbi:hypothetical protein [Pedobacter cryotolerans]|uniref:Uncharacterized protein n=1 Tax=Pedobacter cryotolerans TaxID=2571270 RepID=A0A4U1BXL7_9SPHI|nr:hypothetical protein [Pedobacter cryotolerans]TKB97117.1 hypothetical protein FA045_17165 [Pedobacter cryotolerans]
MKFLAVLILMMVSNFFTMSDVEVATLRKLYYEAAENKAAVKKLSALLAKVNDNSDAILIGYRGATEMMEAKYAFNPVTKLSRFNKGKNYLEKAIKKEPKQAELRFIRFSIQTNLPSFLGYNDHIKIDKDVLINSIVKIDDKQLKNNIIEYLIISKQCNQEEIKKIKNWQKT